MPDNLELFLAPAQSYNTVPNANSYLLLAECASNATLPYEFTVTATTAVATSDTTIALSRDGGADKTLVLRKGFKLKIGATTHTVSATTTVAATGNTSVPIVAATGATAINSEAKVYDCAKLVGVTDIPMSGNPTTVSSKNLEAGYQNSAVVTGVENNLSVAFNLFPGDRAVEYFLLPRLCLDPGKMLYANVVKTYTSAYSIHQVGAAYAVPSFTGALDEITRGTLTLNFQAPYAAGLLYSSLSAGQKTELNTINAKFGIAAYS